MLDAKLTQQEQQIAKAAYYFGFKSANHINGLPITANVEKTVDLLIDISTGNLVLQDTGAEVRATQPNCPTDLESVLSDNASSIKTLALAILVRKS